MTERGKYIVFEGVTCSGKTIYAKLLTRKLRLKKLKAVYHKSTPSSYTLGNLVSEIGDCIPNLLTDTLYELDLLLSNNLRIQEKIKEGFNVIGDKSIDSLKAFIRVNRDGFKRDFLLSSVNKIENLLLEPDLIVYLHASHDERVERILNKNDVSAYDLSVMKNKEKIKKLEDRLEEQVEAKNCIKIDTTGSGIKEVNKRIWEKIKDELKIL